MDIDYIQKTLRKAQIDLAGSNLLMAVYHTEQAALFLRELYKGVDNQLPRGAMAVVHLPTPIRVELTDSGLAVTLPLILPRREQEDRARYLASLLRDALAEFRETNPLPRFRECVLVYEFIYNSSSRRRPTDHDNLELKHCQDVLESFVLTNDSPLLCSSFLCSHRGEGNATRIWVLSPEQFSAWLEAHPEYWSQADFR